MTIPASTDDPPIPTRRTGLEGALSSTRLQPFEAVLAAHEAELYRYLRRFAPSAEEAEDLHQETFVRAYRAYPRLPPQANVRAWLYRIAGNLARDAHRRDLTRRRAGQVDPPRDPAAALPEPADWRSDPHAHAVAAELRAAVRAALLALRPRQRLAVTGRVLDGLDYAELAGILDCSETTARQHVSQGLRRLRADLAPHLETTP